LSNSMKILGIDPGTARMGYSVLQASKTGTFKIIDTDVLITPPDMDMPKRLKMLYLGILKILDKHHPDTMAIEKLFFNTNVKTAIAVGQARGVAMLAAADHDILVFEYTALEVKKLLTGYGRADKKQMQEAVKTIMGWESIVKSDDANDAVAIALCHMKKSSDIYKEVFAPVANTK
jgi:crossover junction endodeoxyribonuclease RuvC